MKPLNWEKFGLVGSIILAIIVLTVVLISILVPNRKAQIDQLILELEKKDTFDIISRIPNLQSARFEINEKTKWIFEMKIDGENYYTENLNSMPELTEAVRKNLLALKKKYE